MKQEGFTRIGATAATGTGQNHNAAGNSAGRLNAVALPDERVAAWLAKQEPEDMDKAAVLRARSRGVGMHVKTRLFFPSGPNGEKLPSYSMAVGCEIHGNPSGLALAITDLENFLTPAPLRQIEAWIAELSVIVAKRRDGQLDEELRLDAYASRLIRYPADVVRRVLIGTSYDWWPTWKEMERQCEALTSPRVQMLAALRRGFPPPEPVFREANAEEKARVQALVDELFPGKSPEDRQAAVAEAMKGDCIQVDP